MNSSEFFYDRQVTLRVINRSYALAAIYLDMCVIKHMDEALVWMFENTIKGTPIERLYAEQGGTMNIQTEGVPAYDHVLRDVDSLITKYGWRVFKSAIVRYAQRRATEFNKRGLMSYAERWYTISTRMDAIPKNVD